MQLLDVKNKAKFCTEKKFIILLVIILVISLFIVIVIDASRRSQNFTKQEKIYLCTTKACISAANMILQNIDETADPCEDFNQFACGTFIKTKRIREDVSGINQFGTLQENLVLSIQDLLTEPNNAGDIEATKTAKTLFRSCLNESSIEIFSEQQLKDFLKEKFSGWPLLGDNYWNENTFNDIETLAVARSYGNALLMYDYIDSHPKDPISAVLTVNQPYWFFDKEYYTSNYTSITDAYKEYMFEFVKILGSTLQDDEIISQIEDVYEIGKSFAQLTLSAAQTRNATFRTMTIQEITDEIPQFKWKEYIIDGIFGNIPNFNMTTNETLIVNDFDYFKNAMPLYQNYTKTKKRALKNMIIWACIKGRTNMLPKKFREAKNAFDKFYSGVSTSEPRSLICAEYVANNLAYATGRLYVAKYFNEVSKNAATEMINYIRTAFENLIKSNNWMDDVSKQRALEKAELIESLVGYPDLLFNETEMNFQHKDLQFKEDDFFQNSFTLDSVMVKKELNTLRKKIDRKRWDMGPAEVNAYYSPTKNHIAFPAGILQAPFYDSQNPNYLNFGGIGSVIGHEITHGFDDFGRKYDKDGVFFVDGSAGLWSNSTIENYKERAKCIVSQYSNYNVKIINKNLDGTQTQGENIADNGGLKESFYAYQKWVEDHKSEPLLPGLNYTQNQLFFINYAQVWCAKYREQHLLQSILMDPHSLPEFRIRGPTSNFVEFSKAFNCKSNTGNNPDKKCTIW